jgi:DNA processing protein
METGQIRKIFRDEEVYPALLRNSPSPPASLYCAGTVESLEHPAVSVIGSRKMTAYGERVIRMLIPDLVRAGLGIDSGLAYGVDSYAQQVAVGMGGSVVAVLGSSFDKFYPRRNEHLAEKIVETGGCVVTEYPPGTPALPAYFPQRNRIVAALSKMTLIIEAGEKSGTLITARQALDAGREVGVVPADITRVESRGVHALLKDGAKPITCSADILAVFGTSAVQVQLNLKPALTGSLATLYDLISRGVGNFDQLVSQSALSIAGVQSILSVLELDGYITRRGNEWQKI